MSRHDKPPLAVWECTSDHYAHCKLISCSADKKNVTIQKVKKTANPIPVPYATHDGWMKVYVVGHVCDRADAGRPWNRD